MSNPYKKPSIDTSYQVLGEPISDDYLPSMGKAVLSISSNVYKQQEMEIDKLINDV
jgi:hypothetical protein